MRTNKPVKTEKTFEGGTAKRISAELQLRRSVMSCLLWEAEFYESGEAIADRIKKLIAQVDPERVSLIAIEAREEMKLRHVPLLIVREMVKLETHRPFVAQTLSRVIQRPDELSEFMAMYWKEGKTPIAAQVKRGLAKAFTKFNEYSLAKYNSKDREIKLRDVLFLCHPKPENQEMQALWDKLAEGTLETPDTWEVALSSGADKKATWERLLYDNKLGGLALLRNLRNMREASVNPSMVKNAIGFMKTDRVLPFRFIAAAKHAPDFESDLETAMFRCLQEMPKLEGRTCLLVDVSGSMDDKLSGKSDLTRLDAACGLAMLLREIGEDVAVRTFSTQLVAVGNRRGFALADSIKNSQSHSGTELGGALKALANHESKLYDRIIVITDEQASDKISDPVWEKAYVINVASAKNGVGYGKWIHVDGWSESVVNFIQELENMNDGR